MVFDTNASPDIFGLFYDRSKVSLIGCITVSGNGVGMRAGERYHFSTVFPHYAIFGDQYIGSSDRKIRALSFTVDDATTLFYDLDAFGSVVDAKTHLQGIVEGLGEDRKIEIGENPLLFYYTGKYEIFSVDTALGKISAINSISWSAPGSEGIHVDNTLKLRIVFDSERIVEEAIMSVWNILQFLEIIAGRPQNVSKLAFFTNNTAENQQSFDVYWSMTPRRNTEYESANPPPG